jgi:signal transduction histidine kinase
MHWHLAIMSEAERQPLSFDQSIAFASSLPVALRGVETDSVLAYLCSILEISVAHVAIDGSIIFANERFHHLNKAFGGEGRVRLPGFQACVSQVQARGSRLSTIQDFSSIDGLSRVWVNLMPVLDEFGKMNGVAAIYQDWTRELTQAELAARDTARFRDFARAASDFFWETDAELNLTHLSDALVALLEQPVSLFIGKSLKALGRLDPNSNSDMPMIRARTTRSAFRHQLLSIALPSGEMRLFHLSGVPIINELGQFSGYRGAASDVTRASRLEEEARLTRNSLEGTLGELQQKNIALDMASSQTKAALNAKNEFLAAMSHELRTPLNAIIGFAEAMELQVFGELGPRYIAYAHDIRGAGQHLLGLINDVLDVSVIESGEIQMQREPMSVARLVDAARSLIALRADAKSIDLSDARVDADYLVLADERRLLQILVNLLTNAVKFTPEGGRIGVTVANAPMGQIAITVWDSGPGIAESDQERVFEKFQQLVDETYRGKPEGTGLGLHISRELARLMSGDIKLQSRAGQGAYFVVTLPAA